MRVGDFTWVDGVIVLGADVMLMLGLVWLVVSVRGWKRGRSHHRVLSGAGNGCCRRSRRHHRKHHSRAPAIRWQTGAKAHG